MPTVLAVVNGCAKGETQPLDFRRAAAKSHKGWGLGVANTAEWMGAPVAEILNRAGLRPKCKDVLFRAAEAA